MFCRAFSTLLMVMSVYFSPKAQAQTWTQIPFQGSNFQAVACSADGTKVVVVEIFRPTIAPTNEGPVWISTDSGATWNTSSLDIPSTNAWGPAAMSADGSKIFIGTGGIGAGRLGTIHGSYDGGVTWTATTAPFARWVSIACSADGETIIATAPNNGPGISYISHNAGISWTSNTLTANVVQGCCTANGAVLVAATPSSLYISTNTGTSWQQCNVPTETYQGLCTTWDGRKIFAMPKLSDRTQISSDFGNTWVTETNLPLGYSWVSAACSSDGAKVVGAGAISDGGPLGQQGIIFTSSDSGHTWTSNNITTNIIIREVTCCADAGNMFVAGRQGVWAFQTNAPPTLEASQGDASVSLRWVIPSQPTTLQFKMDLVQPNWGSIDAIPVTNWSALQVTATVPVTNSREFFRLSSP